MDSMLEHPGIELQGIIKEKQLTQKAFASILGKKVSEVNELLKGKRNITIQRDYLLHQTLGTPIKYWILKQVDYDYSLLNIEETSISSSDKEELGEGGSHSEQTEESTSQQTNFESDGHENTEISPLEQEDTAKLNEFEESQETPIEEPNSKDDEDIQKRAKIFRSF